MKEQNTLIEHKRDDVSSHTDPGFFTPDVTMVLLTWITFFILLAVLYKYAWKPILDALDKREDSIRRSVEEAEKIRIEFERISEKQAKIISDSEIKAKNIIDQSRKAAVEAAKTIETKVREESKILLENAHREIKEETLKAQSDLRAESAHIAVELAAKLLEENLDDQKNRKIVDEYIKEI